MTFAKCRGQFCGQTFNSTDRKWQKITPFLSVHGLNQIEIRICDCLQRFCCCCCFCLLFFRTIHYLIAALAYIHGFNAGLFHFSLPNRSHFSRLKFVVQPIVCAPYFILYCNICIHNMNVNLFHFSLHNQSHFSLHFIRVLFWGCDEIVKINGLWNQVFYLFDPGKNIGLCSDLCSSSYSSVQITSHWKMFKVLFIYL